MGQAGGERAWAHIPLKRGGEVRDQRRKKARQVFSQALCRLRALGEWAVWDSQDPASVWLPRGFAKHSPKAGFIGGGGFQSAGVPHPLLAFPSATLGFLHSVR